MDAKQNRSATRRATSGFTLMEMMVAVAILVILMGVAFVAVINYQRAMKQTELDGTAKELFIAAQNHLSMAKNQGVLKDVNTEREDLVGEKGAEPSNLMRYWYVAPGDSRLMSPNKSTLYEMLPSFSIDDTIRLGGSYVIEYNIQTAQIESVFYSDSSNLSNHHFAYDKDHSTLFDGMKGADNKDGRLHAFGNEDCVIGWYGGEGLNKDVAALSAPTLKLVNAERLYVEAAFTSKEYMENQGATVTVVMRGDTSKKERAVGTFAVTNMSGELSDDGRPYVKRFVLDDITTYGMHFKDQWCSGGTDANNLIPGENISVYAITSTTAKLANIAKSATKHTNSLFANIIQEKNDGGTTTTSVATISNARHLENLDSTISGYDLGSLDKDGTTTVRQMADIRWLATDSRKPVAFTYAISNTDPNDYSNTVTKYENAEDVLVYQQNGEAVKTADNKGTFVPVVPRAKDSTGSDKPFALAYDGNNKKISNVKIDIAGTTERPDAGIFSTLEPGSSVKNLELIDCSVKTSSGNAGTLLGSASGKLDITNVLAHDSSGTVQSKVEGTAAVGGLVGKLTGTADKVTVDGCGAAVLVSTTGAGADGAAGGLIGFTSGVVTVTNSYAGGHTKKDTGMYDTEAFNVVATNGASGGLIGQYAGTAGNAACKIENCYSTASVSRGSGSTGNIGGFVGQATGATITNCYATGLIGAGPTSEDATLDTTRGAFAGSLDSGTVTSLSNNKYYEIINDAEMLKGTLRVVGNAEEAIEAAKLSALDASLIAYNRFYKAVTRVDSGRPSEIDNAKAYDPELVNRYKRTRSAESADEQGAKEKDLAGRYDSIYPLETVYMLNCTVNYAEENDTAGTVAQQPDSKWENEHPWAKSHYGDWPSPETLVVNTKQ